MDHSPRSLSHPLPYQADCLLAGANGMNKETEIEYSPNELINLMLKNEEIHDGNWILSVNFGFSAMNMRSSEEAREVSPSGIVSVQKIGLQRVNVELPFSVNAAVVNPSPKKKTPPKKLK
jgi:hypothetical protein